MPPRATGPAAEVDALDRRAVHEDLAVRHGVGDVGHRRGVEHDAERPVRAARRTVGAEGGLDRADEAAQDAVVVEALDLVAGRLQLGEQRGGVALAAAEAGPEQLDHGAGDVGVLHEHLVHVAGRVAGIDLAPVAAVGTEDRHVGPRHPGRR